MSKFIMGVFITLFLASFTYDSSRRGKMDFLSNYISIKYPEHKLDDYILVEVRQQKLHVIKNGELTKTYTISTALKGIGNLKGSGKTPIGLHKIKSKIGEGTPLGGVLRGSDFTGRVASIYSDTTRCSEDLVTTRAFRLGGVEKGVNKGGDFDTYSRFIYIHGTVEEGLLGQPVSHGCIRMSNADIAEFYDHVQNGMYVLILNL